MLQGNVCIEAKPGLFYSSSPQVPPSLSPSPSAFTQNTPGVNLLPTVFPAPHKPSLPGAWNPTPTATDTVFIAPFDRPNTASTSSSASTSSYRYDMATQAQFHPPMNVDYVTDFSIGTGEHDYHRTSQMGFSEKQDGTFNTQYFPTDQMLIAPVPGVSRMSSESSESRTGSAWKDLAPDLQLR